MIRVTSRALHGPEFRGPARPVKVTARPGLARFFFYTSQPGPARPVARQARPGPFVFSTLRPGPARPANLCNEKYCNFNRQATSNC